MQIMVEGLALAAFRLMRAQMPYEPLIQDITTRIMGDETRHVASWIGNIRRNRKAIEEIAPAFARVLQSYMTVEKMSFERRAALRYMIAVVRSEYELEAQASS